MKSIKTIINYNPAQIEPYWQKVWEETGLYQPDINRSKKPFDLAQGRPFGKTQRKPFYNLMMFPYPSALGLHVGNIYAFVGSDLYGRFRRMQGFDVFEPIGLDGFGIHSENFALKMGKHPMELSKKTESSIYAQLHAIGNGFAWSNKLETYDTNYYKWTQWIFIQLFKRGLAHRAKASVNWCPSCLTVLADEQVVSKSQRVKESKSQKNNQLDSRIWRLETIFVCERCGTEVKKRELEQWFFKITNYAQKLLSGLDSIDWSEKVKVAQRNWIGKSEGLLLKFQSDIENDISVEVFTTRPDTLYGVTFMALAPEHPLVTMILDKSKGLFARQIQKYVADSIKKPESERIGLIEDEKQRSSESVKTGIYTGFHCTHPLSGKKIPLYIADYVLMSYGTGAIMGVPAHDQRDYLFAKKYQIDIVEVVKSTGPAQKIPNSKIQNPNLEKDVTRNTSSDESRRVSHEAFTDYGELVNSEKFNGFKSQDAIGAITNYAAKKGFGTKKVMWHLRDWIISRQRYWGPPIPMIFCQKCAKEGKSWFTSEEAKQYKILNSKHETLNKSKIQNSNDQDSLGFRISDLDIPAKMAGWYPVPESDLPVKLPYIENFKPTGKGVSPLAQDENFVNVVCPSCKSKAKRETDVSDTFLDSAWYFLRYPSVNEGNSKLQTLNSKQKTNSQIQIPNKNLGFRIARIERVSSRKADLEIPWNRQITKRWLPVDMYIGGAEHSVLHLLYSRFLTMVFYDMDLVDFREPFTKFRAHGLLISGGAKMSKSKGNIINPDDYIEKFGADTLRCYLMFCGRFSQGGDFRDTGIEGMHRFLKRVWKLVASAGPVTTFPPASAPPEPSKPSRPSQSSELRAVGSPSSRATRISSGALHIMHKTIKKVTEDIENLRYNTAISAIMEWVNALEERNATIDNLQLTTDKKNKSNVKGQRSNVSLEEIQSLLKLLAPFAPHMAEELWQQVRTSNFKLQTSNFKSVHTHPWPKYDSKLAQASQITLVVQVNGKVRDKIVVDRGIEKEVAQAQALDQKNTQKYLAGKTPKKVIFVKDRLINFVV